jgi:hypothetical protein
MYQHLRLLSHLRDFFKFRVKTSGRPAPTIGNISIRFSPASHAGVPWAGRVLKAYPSGGRRGGNQEGKEVSGKARSLFDEIYLFW